MRHRIVVPLLALAAALGGVSAPARAGGWWSSIHSDGPFMGVGETFTVTSEPMFRSIAAADRARSSVRYYAYLLRGVDRRMVDDAMGVADPGDWWTPPPTALRVGTVRLSRFDANLAAATARITVPRVAPGRWSLMLCTAGCARPLANVVPAGVRVSPDATLAARSRRLTATKWRLRQTAAVKERQLTASRRRVEHLRDRLTTESRQVEELSDRIRGLSAVPAGDSSGGSGPGGAVGFLAGLVVGGGAVGFRRRSRASRSSPGPSGEPAAARR